MRATSAGHPSCVQSPDRPAWFFNPAATLSSRLVSDITETPRFVLPPSAAPADEDLPGLPLRQAHWYSHWQLVA
jgi:hypothetical protein